MYCGIWDRCILGFMRLCYYLRFQEWHSLSEGRTGGSLWDGGQDMEGLALARVPHGAQQDRDVSIGAAGLFLHFLEATFLSCTEVVILNLLAMDLVCLLQWSIVNVVIITVIIIVVIVISSPLSFSSSPTSSSLSNIHFVQPWHRWMMIWKLTHSL